MVKGGFENVGTRNYVTMIFHSAQMEAMPFKAYPEDFTTSHPFTASIRATSMTPQDSSFCVRLLNLPSCQIPPGRILTCMSTWETTCIPIRCERHAPVMAAHDDRRGARSNPLKAHSTKTVSNSPICSTVLASASSDCATSGQILHPHFLIQSSWPERVVLGKVFIAD